MDGLAKDVRRVSLRRVHHPARAYTIATFMAGVNGPQDMIQIIVLRYVTAAIGILDQDR